MRAGFALLPRGHFRVTREPLAGEPRVCMNLRVSGTVVVQYRPRGTSPLLAGRPRVIREKSLPTRES